MITAPALRKQLLNIFESKLIPSLLSPTGEKPLLVLAEPPFHFPDGVEMRQLPVRPLREKNPAGEMVRHWENAKVNAMAECPCLMYLCEGEADFRIGVTQKMAKILKAHGQKADSGCWIVSLRAPALILFPPGVPYSNGSRRMWERTETADESMTLIKIRLTNTGTLCAHSVREDESYEVHHPLLVDDPLLSDAYGILCDEMRRRTINWESVALLQLQIFMLRLQRDLTLNHPVIASTTWASPPLNKSFSGSSRDVALLSELHEYIQIHLRERLTLPQIAAHAKLSPTHLNRIFQSNLGITPVHYVTRLRMEAAWQILYDSPQLPIKEVMALVGYEDPAHFSRAFNAAHGISPRTFRARRRKEIPAATE